MANMYIGDLVLQLSIFDCLGLHCRPLIQCCMYLIDLRVNAIP